MAPLLPSLRRLVSRSFEHRRWVATVASFCVPRLAALLGAPVWACCPGRSSATGRSCFGTRTGLCKCARDCARLTATVYPDATPPPVDSTITITFFWERSYHHHFFLEAMSLSLSLFWGCVFQGVGIPPTRDRAKCRGVCQECFKLYVGGTAYTFSRFSDSAVDRG